MIKTAIATAIVASSTVATTTVFAAGHASAEKSVSVYGRLRMAAVCTDAGGTTNTDCGLENRSSRFGIKATSQISDGLTAFGRYEFGVNADEGALSNGTQTNRLAYVGLKGGFGEVSIGTRWSPFYNHTISPIDPTNAFGGTWNSGAGYLTDFRNSDTINYKNKFGAASVGVQLQMDDGDLGNDAIDEVSVGVSFKAGSATIGLGYLDTKDVQSVAAIHARSKFGPVSVGGTYSSLSSDTIAPDADAIAIALGYAMGGGSSVNLTYGQTDFDGGNTPTEIGLEYVKNMGAGFKWFAGFDIADPDTTADNTNRYGAGMRYDF